MSGETFGYRREKRLPHAARIVYQGLEGAYSTLAAVQIFRDYEEASFSHVKSFDAAVRAVDEGTHGPWIPRGIDAARCQTLSYPRGECTRDGFHR